MIPPLLPTYKRNPLAFDRGEGAYLYARDGRRYLDFGSGIAVTAMGHAHAHLVRTLSEQAAKLWHVSNLYEIPEQQRLAERLVANSFGDTVFFCNSGAEAVECGIKTVRRYHHQRGEPRRYRIVTVEGAFHGRTLATLAAGGQAKYLEGFGPPVAGFDQVPFGDLAAARAAVTPETAAILVEPVQGEGGVRVMPPEYLRGLRELADEHGLLLFFDEVQCGMGRTGRLFAHEWAGVAPDVMALAKGLGGGFPVGACLATERAASGMTDGSHGSTFGGNPLAMAVGNAVLDVLLEPGFLERVRDRGRRLREGVSALRHPNETGGAIEEARGLGLLLGLKLRPSAAAFAERLREHGLLAVPAGDNVLRLLPPLNVEDEQIDEALDAIERACEEFSHGDAAAALSRP